VLGGERRLILLFIFFSFWFWHWTRSGKTHFLYIPTPATAALSHYCIPMRSNGTAHFRPFAHSTRDTRPNVDDVSVDAWILYFRSMVDYGIIYVHKVGEFLTWFCDRGRLMIHPHARPSALSHRSSPRSPAISPPRRRGLLRWLYLLHNVHVKSAISPEISTQINGREHIIAMHDNYSSYWLVFAQWRYNILMTSYKLQNVTYYYPDYYNTTDTLPIHNGILLLSLRGHKNRYT